MKIPRIIIAISVFSTLLASCSQALTEDESCNESYITATISPETRTTMGDNENGSYKVLWSEGDEIALSSGGKSYLYSAIEGGSSSASFKPSGNAVTDFTQGAIAGYPAESMILPDPGTDDFAIFTIPSTQAYVENSFADGTMPMISDVSYGSRFSFRNIAAVLKFVISGPEQVKITSLAVTTDLGISGDCCYDIATDSYASDPILSSSSRTTVDCGQGVTVGPEGTAFHVVVPHQKYTSMSITATSTDGKQHVFKLKSGKELNVKRNSVLTIPLAYEEFGVQAGPSVTITTRAVTFTSFSVNISMSNVTSYACDLTTKRAFDAGIKDGSLIASIPYLKQYTAPLEYNGSATRFQEAFAEMLIEAGKSYVLWIVPYKAKGDYSVDDIVSLEVTTESYKPGGTSVITADDVVLGMTEISMQLSSSESVSTIFNCLLDEEELARYPTEQDKIDLLIKGGAYWFEGISDLVVNKFLLPAKKYTQLAIGVDRHGYYGKLFVEEFTTLGLPYNDITISIEEDIAAVRKNNTLKWDTTGGEAASYRYILYETDSYRWLNTFYSSIEIAETKLILESGLYYIEKTTNPYAVLDNAAAGKEYVLVVVAIDAAGNASKPDSWIFTY